MDLGKKNNIIFIVFCIVISVLLFNGFRLIEKQNTWNYFYNYYYLLKQDHAILKNSIVTYEDLVDKSKIGLMENKNKFDFIVPQKLDIPSMLIFLEKYSSKFSLQTQTENKPNFFQRIISFFIKLFNKFVRGENYGVY